MKTKSKFKLLVSDFYNLKRLVARILDSLNAGNGGGRKTLVHFKLQLEGEHCHNLYKVLQSCAAFQLKYCRIIITKAIGVGEQVISSLK